MSKIIKTEGKESLQLQAKLFSERTVKIRKDQLQDVKMNVEIFDNLVHEFKEVYNKLDVLRKEYKDHFDYTNLKLHDVASLVYDSDKYRHADFSFFCEMEYLNFQDYLFEKRAKLDYIGRTSSFYVTCDSADIDMIDTINNHDTDTLFWESLRMVGAMDSLIYDDLLKGYLSTDTISRRRFLDEAKEIEIDMQYLDEFVSVTLPENLAAIQEVYEYIQNFKDNQVEIFKEFMNHE